MQKVLFACVLWLMVSVADATTINPVLIDQEETSYRAVAVLDDRLLYERKIGDVSELWAFDPINSSQTFLMTLMTRFGYNQRNYQVHNGVVYFQGDIEGREASGVWLTDLTPEGTDELPGNYTFGNFTVSDGILFATQAVRDTTGNGFNYQLAQISELGTTAYELPVLRSSSRRNFVCAFDAQSLVVLTSKENNTTAITRYDNGTITELEEIDIGLFQLEIRSMFAHDDNCFIALNGGNVFRVSASGAIQNYYDTEEVAAYRTSHFLRLNERVYGAGFAGFYRLDPSYQSFDLGTEIGTGYWGNSSFRDARVFQNHIVVLQTITADPPPRFLSFLNAQLEWIDSSEVIGDNRYFYSPDVFDTADTSLLRLKYDFRGNTQDLMVAPLDITSSSIIKNRRIRVDQIIADPGSLKAFLNATNTTTQNKGIYAVEENPLIGDQINGPWIDLTRERQGLVITKGVRSDGSEYLFVTIYTYRNGEPLWLAGTAEIGAYQQSITFPIHEYNGIGLFEQGSMPEQVEFGTMTLNFSGCDGLNAAVDYDNTVVNMDLTRVDDVTFADLCVD